MQTVAIHRKLTCWSKPPHTFGPYLSYYLIEGASDEASMGMLVRHRRSAVVLPIFLQQAVGVFSF
jgi:hypothetical protein